MSDKLRVGMIGVGLMGHGMAKNIVTKGYPLTVMAHRNRKPVENLLSLGAREAKSPKEIAAASDLVILCVTGTPEVEATVYGEEGLLGAVREGLIIADCSTAVPQSTVKIAADVAAKGGHYVDTPLTRTPKEAEAGKLGVMTGGDRAVLDRIRPVIECFADTIVHAGPVGAAHTLKLINNFIGLGNAMVAAEAIVAAKHAGVAMEALRDIVLGGGARSLMFERIIKVPLENDDSAAQFAIRNARKDLRYYTNMTGELPVTSFMAEAVHQTLVLADNLGFGDRFVPRLVDALEKANGGKK
ncbi:MAG: NAD(P)-dependent oxidoreductase [Rhizobiales bacterium]|nr:NAD(P)-dependent oxidoreductase [Hyphomicrobiales bacterium]